MLLQECKLSAFISDGLEYSKLPTRWNGLRTHRETQRGLTSACPRFSAQHKLPGLGGSRARGRGKLLFTLGLAENPEGSCRLPWKFYLIRGVEQSRKERTLSVDEYIDRKR